MHLLLLPEKKNMIEVDIFLMLKYLLKVFFSFLIIGMLLFMVY